MIFQRSKKGMAQRKPYRLTVRKFVWWNQLPVTKPTHALNQIEFTESAFVLPKKSLTSWDKLNHGISVCVAKNYSQPRRSSVIESAFALQNPLTSWDKFNHGISFCVAKKITNNLSKVRSWNQLRVTNPLTIWTKFSPPNQLHVTKLTAWDKFNHGTGFDECYDINSPPEIRLIKESALRC
jgi:hypothetical protein